MLLKIIQSKDFLKLKKYVEKFEKDSTIESYYFCVDDKTKKNFYYRLKKKCFDGRIKTEDYKRIY